jgi:ferric-dicitrate binding protein FerR (iron transport regulator)
VAQLDGRLPHGRQPAPRGDLGDGTQLTLNTNTSVNVAYSGGSAARTAGRRNLHRHRQGCGAAAFFVTPHGSLQALGTRFTVRLHDGYASAGVLEGAIAVLADDGSQRLVLHPGEGAPRQTAITARRWRRTEARGSMACWWRATCAWPISSPSCRAAERSPAGLHSIIAGLRVSGSYPLADVDAILDAVSASCNCDAIPSRASGDIRWRIELAPPKYFLQSELFHRGRVT